MKVKVPVLLSIVSLFIVHMCMHNRVYAPAVVHLILSLYTVNK